MIKLNVFPNRGKDRDIGVFCIYINESFIQSFFYTEFRYEFDDHEIGSYFRTILTMTSGKAYDIQETPEQIISLMKSENE